MSVWHTFIDRNLKTILLDYYLTIGLCLYITSWLTTLTQLQTFTGPNTLTWFQSVSVQLYWESFLSKNMSGPWSFPKQPETENQKWWIERTDDRTENPYVVLVLIWFLVKKLIFIRKYILLKRSITYSYKIHTFPWCIRVKAHLQIFICWVGGDAQNPNFDHTLLYESKTLSTSSFLFQFQKIVNFFQIVSYTKE